MSRAAGLAYVAAAGEVLDPRQLDYLVDGVGVFFDPAALGEDARSPWPAWRAHPLLFPFLHGHSGGVLRLEVPADRRPVWDNAIRSIETELTARREGHRQAALAHLTLLLIELARLARDVVADLRRSGEPLLADVFAVIDRRHGEPLSLRDVAGEVGMTPGHLTTVVRRRTGRTVVEFDVAYNGHDALELVRRRDYGLALIDYRMPGMDGVELVGKIRELRPNLVAVLVTGFPTIDTVYPAISIGVERVIGKPAGSDELLAVIEEFVGIPA